MWGPALGGKGEVLYMILLLYSQYESAVSVLWPHACALLAPEKEEFSPRRRLHTLLCTDKMTVTL